MSGIQSVANDVDVDLGALFSSLARRWLRILIVAVIVTGLALAFAVFATPKYKGETRILIETQESVFTRPDGANSDSTSFDEEGVTSQVQLVSSTEVLKKVAQQLDLASRKEFNNGGHLGTVGRALVLEPSLLILDEPTEGIQPNIVHEIGDVVLRLNKEEGLTVLLVEQKLPFARRVASEFCILEKGRSVASGPIDALTDDVVKAHLSV